MQLFVSTKICVILVRNFQYGGAQSCCKKDQKSFGTIVFGMKEKLTFPFTLPCRCIDIFYLPTISRFTIIKILNNRTALYCFFSINFNMCVPEIPLWTIKDFELCLQSYLPALLES